MPPIKRTGFFWEEDNLTVVELEKNSPLQVVSSNLGQKTNSNLPFSSSLTEEMQVTTDFQKILSSYNIKMAEGFVSLPMKDTILRSFVVPWVRPADLKTVVAFEAKKYLPFEMKDIAYAFYPIPFTENKIKSFRIILFAVRSDVLEKYARIFKQAGMQIAVCEPSAVSLIRALIFKKEVRQQDKLAFLNLDRNIGRICFFSQGIPQFIREFQIAGSQIGEFEDDKETLKVRLFNEVGNSFDFYSRQFNLEKIDQLLVASNPDRQELLDGLAAELKITVKNFNPVVAAARGTTEAQGMNSIYALGVGLDFPLDSLGTFNFLEKKAPPSIGNFISNIDFNQYQDAIKVFFLCAALLTGGYYWAHWQLDSLQKKIKSMSVGAGAYLNVPIDSIQSEISDNTTKLTNYKSVRIDSEVAMILVRVAQIIPHGGWLRTLDIRYTDDGKTSIDMQGYFYSADPKRQMSAVNELLQNIKTDKILSKYITDVNPGPLQKDVYEDNEVTSFTINCK